MKLATFFSSSTTRMRIASIIDVRENLTPINGDGTKAKKLYSQSFISLMIFRANKLAGKTRQSCWYTPNTLSEVPDFIGLCLWHRACQTGGVVRKRGRFQHENPGCRP